MPRAQAARGRARRDVQGRGRGLPVRNVRPPARNQQQNREDRIFDILRELRHEQEAQAVNLATQATRLAALAQAQALPAPALVAPPAEQAQALPAPAPILDQAALDAIPVPVPPKNRVAEAYKQLPQFDGTVSYAQFELQFAGIMKMYPDVAPADKALLLIRCLKGQAMAVLRSFPKLNPSFEALNEALLDMFPHQPKPLEVLLMEFNELKQGSTESLLLWRNRVVAASWEAHGRKNEAASILKFIRGMCSPLLRSQLATCACPTIEAAYNMALEIQRNLGPELTRLGQNVPNKS